MNLKKRSNANSKKFLKLKFIIPAAIAAIEKGSGSKAPTAIRKPPHFRILIMCLLIFTSI